LPSQFVIGWREVKKVDLKPSLHWPEPQFVVEPEHEHGPVLVTVEYLIDTERSAEFAETMRKIRRERLRDGAMRWGLFNDPATPSRYVETFLVESWVEHVRQHERVTRSDLEVEKFGAGVPHRDAPLKIFHLIRVD
jgi:hypothetical protein